jgi:hypothetical protein
MDGEARRSALLDVGSAGGHRQPPVSVLHCRALLIDADRPVEAPI